MTSTFTVSKERKRNVWEVKTKGLKRKMQRKGWMEAVRLVFVSI